ncbi:DUF1588 domain-containing protein [Nannocystaceae bacterium ST9]
MLALVALAPGCKDDPSDGEDEVGDGDDTTAGDDTTGDDGGDTYVPPPGGMRRLLDYQYLNTIELMFGPEARLIASHPNDIPLHGYTSIGSSDLSPGLDSVELYEFSALAIADTVLANPTTLAGLVPCIGEAQDDTCYTEVAETLGHLAWRRPLSADEVASVVEAALAGKAWGEGDFEAGLKYELVRLLISPHFIYVTEVGVQDPDEPEEFVLTGPEIVTRMSLLLNGRIPRLDLLAEAEAGMYDDAAALEQLARTMIAAPEAENALAEFFGEYLDVDSLPAKDTEVFPLYTEALTDSMTEETHRMLRDIIWDKDTDFRLFLDADYTFVDDNLAAVYGVPAPGAWTQTSLPAEQNRAGFLTQGAFLTRNSHIQTNSTTRRGNYIQARFLCFAVPPPPGDVVPQIPEPPGEEMTLRDLMELVHLEEASCASCHQYMDPLAFPLENYDAIGAFRTVEPNGLPINPVVEDATFGLLENGADLAASISMDPRLPQCLVNNLVRFGRGRLEDPDNEPDELLALYDEFEAANFRVQEMLVKFVTSPLFRQVGEPK